ncbi:hypothetical protein C8N35_113108 [Breoghania corrubedonensis]|uniref:Hpr(Ser) kinase/phosphatase n=1 Tax=Breoghania corrubedonensis TaxID=665038 RepID=A0A2T5UU69_9HYPH|nr:serine kinase [Breoghania corrubedonensis]PTW55067.1 hypothetical protein C8N35_113108 [Breoghania corrubedonensis]
MRDALENENLLGVHDPDRDLWQFYDPQAGEGVQLMTTTDALPPWETSIPLRLFIHWAMHGIGRPLVHAGTLGLNGRCVFLAGPGGSGKSGTTLCGILDGLTSVGDDYILAEITPENIVARPIVKLMKQDPAGLERLKLTPSSPLFQGPNWQGKFEFDFAALAPSASAQALEGTAILLPLVGNAQRTTTRPASSKEAMLALAPSSFAQLFGTWRADLEFLARFCRRIPAWHVQLGTDPDEVAQFVRTFLSRGHP